MQNIISYNRQSLVLAVVIFFAFILRLFAVGNMDLIAEEAYYWNYANHLDFSYFDHPPMVAYLIKISTLIFGVNEFAVRVPAILCWGVAVYYCYKLTEEINPNSGRYSWFLISILPFFFVQSVIITPDLPLIAAWSACLYYLYRVLVNDSDKDWYKLGISFGLGMISKYTIVLLIPATILYMATSKNKLKKFITPYPYIACGIALVIFIPVIYWNATHNWASFAFQSTRRFTTDYEFSLHHIFGLLALFLTPLGLFSLYSLIFKPIDISFPTAAKKFLQIYTLFPLGFFMAFSVLHTTKFNWIGPGLLAIIPWMAIEISNKDSKFIKAWEIIASVLLIIYSIILICILTGKPSFLYTRFFSKFNSWDNFYSQIRQIATTETKKNNKPVIIVPLDKYNIASELNFYQAKNHHKDLVIFGRNVLGQDALMYNYWNKGEKLTGKNVLIIHNDKYMVDALSLTNILYPTNSINILFSISQGYGTKANKFYYQIGTINPGVSTN